LSSDPVSLECSLSQHFVHCQRTPSTFRVETFPKSVDHFEDRSRFCSTKPFHENASIPPAGGIFTRSAYLHLPLPHTQNEGRDMPAPVDGLQPSSAELSAAKPGTGHKIRAKAPRSTPQYCYLRFRLSHLLCTTWDELSEEQCTQPNQTKPNLSKPNET